MGAIILHRNWIDHAAARESEPLLAREIGNFLDQAKRERVAAAFEKLRGKEARHIVHCDRPKADPAFGGRDLDQRLEPIEPRLPVRTMRTRSLRCSASRVMAAATSSAPTDTAAESRGIKSVTLPSLMRGVPFAARQSDASIFLSSSRPLSAPSIIAAGASAQLPRQ